MRTLAVLASIGLAVSVPSPAGAQPVSEAVAKVVRAESPRPRLIVVISIDQLRTDLLTRFADQFVPAGDEANPGGFRYLLDRGAFYVSSEFEHFPLHTGPGHSVIMTGAHPCKTGIIGNVWWDAAARRMVYCVEDPRWKVVGAAEGSRARPMGPKLLRTTTVGDELKLATAGKGKVVSLAMKDRSAILMGGHAQDVCIWYDVAGGRWISSSAYAKSGVLPEWVEAVNAEAIPTAALGSEWTLLLDPAIIESRCIAPARVSAGLPPDFGKTFPHRLGKEPTARNYHQFIYMPECNQYVLGTAARAVREEKLGADETPDILNVSLSSNDYVGHSFGPYSPEVADITVRTDRALAEFFASVQQEVPGGLASTVIVLTADHGVSPVPEDARALGIEAGRFSIDAVVGAIDKGLRARFGNPVGKSWFSTSPQSAAVSGAFLDGMVWFDRESVDRVIAEGHGTRDDIESVARDAVDRAAIEGVYAAYGRQQILEGRVPDTRMQQSLAKGLHPRLAPDLIVIPESMYLEDPISGGEATNHGAPFTYDSRVPVLLAAPGLVQPGVYAGPSSPADIAPTLSLLLGIQTPSGSEGRVLTESLSER